MRISAMVQLCCALLPRCARSNAVLPRVSYPLCAEQPGFQHRTSALSCRWHLSPPGPMPVKSCRGCGGRIPIETQTNESESTGLRNGWRSISIVCAGASDAPCPAGPADISCPTTQLPCGPSVLRVLNVGGPLCSKTTFTTNFTTHFRDIWTGLAQKYTKWHSGVGPGSR